MTEEITPPGQTGPLQAGGGNSLRLLYRQRAAWIKPSTHAPFGANPLSGHARKDFPGSRVARRPKEIDCRDCALLR